MIFLSWPGIAVQRTASLRSPMSRPSRLGWHGIASLSGMGGSSPRMTESELLHPRPQLDLVRPGAARLLEHGEISRGDGVGIEQRIRADSRLDTARAPDAAVDHEMRDVNALRR